jgi:gluconate 2-dehydrogenase gamma chain
MAGGSVAALFPSIASAKTLDQSLSHETRWQIIDRVQQHLFPSETDAPGAKEINALGYLRFVVADEQLDIEDREFVLQGAGWLEDISLQSAKRPFLELNDELRELVLRQVEQSDAGENWLSTLLLYLFEALLTDPVYGGNPNGIGWQWLGHRPGFPRPPANKRYGVLA